MSDMLTVIGEACGQVPYIISSFNIGTCTASACSTPIAGLATETKCVADSKKEIITLMGASPYILINIYTNSTTCTGTSFASAVAADGKCRKTPAGAIELYSKLLWDGKALSGGAYSDAACATPFGASASGSTPIPKAEDVSKCISAGAGSAKTSLMDKGAEVVVAGAIGTGTAGTAAKGSSSGVSLKAGLFVVSLVFGALLI